MTELTPGTIPLTTTEKATLRGLKDVISLTRNEHGVLQAETKNGAIWLISKTRAERIK